MPCWVGQERQLLREAEVAAQKEAATLEPWSKGQIGGLKQGSGKDTVGPA